MFGIDSLGISDGQYKKRKQTIIKRKLSAIPGPTKAQARELKKCILSLRQTALLSAEGKKKNWKKKKIGSP
jgi:hypothetical protein